MKQLLVVILLVFIPVGSFGQTDPACLIARVPDPNPRKGGRFGWSLQRVGKNFAASSITELGLVGRVYLFDGETGDVLTELQHPHQSPTTFFGLTLAAKDNLLLVGEAAVSSFPGSAHLYDCDPTSSQFGQALKSFPNPTLDSLELYGHGLAMTDRFAMIADPKDDYIFGNSGTVFVYDADPESPTFGDLLDTLHHPNPANESQFGSPIAIQGNDISFRHRLMRWNPVDQGLFDSVINLSAPGSVTGGIRFLTAGYGHILGGIPDDHNLIDSGGAVHIYNLSESHPRGSILKTLVEPSPSQGAHFGSSVTTLGSLVFVGSPGTNRGQAYIYDGDPTSPDFGELVATLNEPPPIRFGEFGKAITTAGANIVVSAPFKYSRETTLTEAGEVFIYKHPVPCSQVSILSTECLGSMEGATAPDSFRIRIYENHSAATICGATDEVPLVTLVDCEVDCSTFHYSTGPSCADVPRIVLDALEDSIHPGLVGFLSASRLDDQSISIESTTPIQIAIGSEEVNPGSSGYWQTPILDCSLSNLCDGIPGNEFDSPGTKGILIRAERGECPSPTPIPTLTPTPSPALAPSTVVDLAAAFDDVVMDEQAPVLYGVNSRTHSLHAVEISNGMTSEPIVLPATPERLAYSAKDRKLVVTITEGHYDYDGPDRGQIGVIDIDTWTLDVILPVPVDPWDVAADRDGFLYISPGSNQRNSGLVSINQATGKVVSILEGMRHRTYVETHPVRNSIYAADTDLYPRDIDRYRVQCGVLFGGVDFPYHENHPAGQYFRFSPEGDALYTSTGNIYHSTDTAANEMTFIGQIPMSFRDIAVDGLRGRVYLVAGDDVFVHSFDSTTYERVGYPEDIGLIGRYCFLRSDQLIVIGEKIGESESGEWGYRVLSAETWDNQPTPTPTATPTPTPSPTHPYDYDEDNLVTVMDLLHLLTDEEVIPPIFDFSLYWYKSVDE